MSKLMRLFEFVSASWVAAVASLGNYMAYQAGVFEGADAPVIASAIVTVTLIVGGAIWHIVRAVRGR